VTFLRAGS